jgi:hypothetical protein
MKVHMSDIWRLAGFIGAAMLFPGSIAIAGAPGEVLACSIEARYDYGKTGCRNADEGFAQAERFRIDTKRQRLTACLWSACFSGNASIWSTADGEIQGAARLRRDHGREFLTLTFTLLKDRRFSTMYGTGELATAVAFGKCERESVQRGGHKG